MPNIPEAEALTGRKIQTEQDMLAVGQALCDLGCKAALIKGGHREGQPTDVFFHLRRRSILRRRARGNH